VVDLFNACQQTAFEEAIRRPLVQRLHSAGQIAGMLEFDTQQKPIAEFSPVSGCVVKVKDTVINDLSTDQLYLLKICLLIQCGYHASENHISYLQTAQPGAISHARWLTKANRLLRLYVSQEGPSDSLTVGKKTGRS